MYVVLELELVDVAKVVGGQAVGELPKGPGKECVNTSVIGSPMLVCLLSLKLDSAITEER